ncbi:MAG: hypothetical protein M3Q38_06735 [Chloroflexota bacterium]|nr:hypothetical protein [Chloroflexota bacterium]
MVVRGLYHLTLREQNPLRAVGPDDAKVVGKPLAGGDGVAQFLLEGLAIVGMHRLEEALIVRPP